MCRKEGKGGHQGWSGSVQYRCRPRTRCEATLALPFALPSSTVGAVGRKNFGLPNSAARASCRVKGAYD